MSLGLRLNLLLALIVLASLGGALWTEVTQARQAVADELQSTIDLASLLLEAVVEQHRHAEALPRLLQMIDTIRAGHLDIRLVDARAGRGPPARGAPRAPDWFVALVEPEPARLERSVLIPGSALKLEIRADPADELTESWRKTRRTLTALVLLAAALTAAFVCCGRLVLRPLSQIAAALGQIEARRFGIRLGRFGVPDVDTIAEGFNRMAAAQERDAREVEELARRALVIREEERRHLAHELHDEMGQSISAIKALAVAISRRADPGDPKVKQSADTIAEISSHVYERVRQMMSQLRPTTLDELGLVSALEDMIDTWNSHHETAFCGFTRSGQLPPLTSTQSINIFRIVQEALTNIAKHASARHASVTLGYRADMAEGGELLLKITDDGAGFDITARRRGLGLVGLHERVKALGGKLALASRPGNGTQFDISIPLNSQPSSELHEQDPHPAGG